MQMVENFLAGGAAINIFCRQYNIELAVFDMGVNGNLDDHPMLIKHKVAPVTGSFQGEGTDLLSMEVVVRVEDQ